MYIHTYIYTYKYVIYYRGQACFTETKCKKHVQDIRREEIARQWKEVRNESCSKPNRKARRVNNDVLTDLNGTWRAIGGGEDIHDQAELQRQMSLDSIVKTYIRVDS